MKVLKKNKWREVLSWKALIFPSLLLVGLGLRFYRLNEGMWLDEIITYVRYARLPFTGIVTSFESENNHILFTLLARLSLLIFGESVAAFRLPAVLFGVGSLWAMYQFGKEVTSRTEAWLAMALLTFSYHHIWFSQNGRGYSALLFFSLLASWLFLVAWRTGNPKTWVVFGILTALGAYAHLTMIFVTVGQFIILMIAWTSPRVKKWVKQAPALRSEQAQEQGTGQVYLTASEQAPLLRSNPASSDGTGQFPSPRSAQVAQPHASPVHWHAILGFGSAAVLTFLLYAPVLPQILGAGGKLEASVVQEWKNPLWTAWEILRGLQIGLAGWMAGGVIGLLALLVLFAGMLDYLRSRPALVGLLFLPAGIGAMVVIGLGHHLWPRFFYFAFGFAVLVVLRGIVISVQVAGKIIRRVLAKWVQGERQPPRQDEGRTFSRLAYLGCILLVGLSALSVPGAYGPKQDFVGAMEYVQANRQAGDAVVVFSLTELPYTGYLQTDWMAVHSLEELQAIQASAARTWAVITLLPVARSVYPQIMERIDQEFNLVKTFPGTLNEGAVFIYNSK